jgi:Cu(I)/Ag(I) efflux system membrane fusion protein
MKKFHFGQRPLILAVLGLTSAGLIFPACNRSKSTAHESVERVDASTIRVYKEAVDNLKLSKASVLNFPDQLFLMGKISITEDRTNIVPARVSGRIESIAFASGEHVTQGQLLAKLFSADFLAAKEEYLQSLKQSKAGPGNSDLSDFQNLSDMAKKKLETMGLGLQDIRALETTHAASDGPGSLLTIRAPRSGVIITKSAVLGNLVNAGDTLFIIGDMSKVWFLGDLYPEDLQKVRKNQEVLVNVAGEEKPIRGQVSFISPLVDPTTRSIKIRALMDNPKEILKSDMYVQGSVILNQDRALLIPSVSIFRTGEINSVFKRISPASIEKELKNIDFKKVEVKAGPERQGMTAITQGLKEGDEVVSDGAWLLDAALNTSQEVAK